MSLRITLLADGSSDASLLPLILWLLRQHGVTLIGEPNFAKRDQLPPAPSELERRMEQAVYMYPCDVLFVHRDAEGVPLETRRAEVDSAMQACAAAVGQIVAVVPVRMTEAWLLFDEAAIRRASGNPSGRIPIEIPRLQQLEATPNPKGVLFEALRRASGQHGRKLRKLQVRSRVHRLAELISDYSPLRGLQAFRALEEQIEDFVAEWKSRDDE